MMLVEFVKVNFLFLLLAMHYLEIRQVNPKSRLALIILNAVSRLLIVTVDLTSTPLTWMLRMS